MTAVAEVPDLDVHLTASQRWTLRKLFWKIGLEEVFDPARYRVVEVDEPTARKFVTTHHYSGAYCADKLRYGLLDELLDGDQLVGVAVLGVPMSNKVLTGPFPTLVPCVQSLELSRLVLLDSVPANGESWFVSRVFRSAATYGVRGVVAFSDPVPRRVGGQVLMPGHIGWTYQGLNSIYTGRATPRTLTMLPDGTVLSARSRAKLTGGESGARYVHNYLVSLGATPMPTRQEPTQWLREALEQIGARRVRHRGNHRYVWKLGSTTDQRWTPIGFEELPYPKATDPIIAAGGSESKEVRA